MMKHTINYEAPVFRPPSEANSFLIQVTIGCSNNLCTYCDMYRSKKYRVRDLSEIFLDLEKVLSNGIRPKRFFLCDGDALGAPMEILVPTLQKINELFPEVERIGIYATAKNILEKSNEDLKLLNQMKLGIAYLGLETGLDKLLHMIVKGNTKQEMIDASLKIKEAGFKLSTMALLGLGGRELSNSHCEETAQVISETSPHYFSFLSTVAIEGTPYARMVDRGRIHMLSTKELLQEMYSILDKIKPRDNKILFRANHVSNQFPLGGSLPQDKDFLLQTLKSWIEQTPEGVMPPRPSSM